MRQGTPRMTLANCEVDLRRLHAEGASDAVLARVGGRSPEGTDEEEDGGAQGRARHGVGLTGAGIGG